MDLLPNLHYDSTMMRFDAEEAFFLGDTVDRPVAADEWFVPDEVHLKAGRLSWGYATGRTVTPTRTAFEEFLRLRDAPDEAIRAYAQRWGLLYLCRRHRLPSSHAHFEPPDTGRDVWIAPNVLMDEGTLKLKRSGWFQRCPLNCGPHDTYWERTDDWRRYAREARALFALASELHRNELGNPDHWETLHPTTQLGETIVNQLRPSSVGDARLLLTTFVNRWLALGHVQPALGWGLGKPFFTFGNRTLFGYLAVQLLLLTGKTDGLAICTNCGEPYLPSRRPARGRRPYCGSCGIAAAQRAASKTYRDKKRRARELRETGKSMREVAAMLDARFSSVRGWLAEHAPRQRHRRLIRGDREDLTPRRSRAAL